MAKVFIEETTLTNIGDAIRGKEGTTELVPVNDMATRITNLPSGGGDLPEEAFTYSGNLGWFTYQGMWDWFIKEYGNRVTTKNVYNAQYSFSYSKLTKIPFVLNVDSCGGLQNCFQNCDQLTEVPKVRGNLTWNTSTNFEDIFQNCARVRDFEEAFEPSMLDGFKTVKITSTYSAPSPVTFYGCCSLREVPTWWYKQTLNEESTAFPYSSKTPYYNCFYECYALNKVTDIPVWRCQGTATSNMFDKTFNNTYRLNAITFETNDGQPIEANWKNQVIDLGSSSSYIGYARTASRVSMYNSGITADKEVKDDATYQALKNDPDWFTANLLYSRYNHDSAVETINSLPDTSAGGTNTIQFQRNSGYHTDGGHIGKLTAEETAVATAKGWTVALL